MATAREWLATWLRDAHAAEEQAHTMMTGTARSIQEYPEFSAGLQQHGERSGRQAGQLKACLLQMDESTSFVKDLVGHATALAQTLSGLVVGDEVIKAALAISTFIQMEVSSYRILIAAARAADEVQTEQLCEDLLAEELEFSTWMEQQVPLLTAEYLRREETGAAAPLKR